MSFSGRSTFGTSSPLPEPANATRRRRSRLESPRLTKLWRYLSKLIKFDHMDFESAAWQMVYLFTAPNKVYRNMYYRKQTKNQYGRDDPAFLVLLSVWCVIAAAGLSLLLGFNFFRFVMFLLYVVFVDCITFGLVMATIFWLFSNHYLRSSIDDQVEWAFAFDIHLNAYFPSLLIVHVFQLFVYSSKRILKRFLSFIEYINLFIFLSFLEQFW